MRAFVTTPILVLASSTFLFAASPEAPPRPVDDQYHAVTALRDMNSLAIAIEAYAQDHGAYPKVGSAEELLPLLVPAYAQRLESRDAWGTAFRYRLSPDGASYVLVSAGSDRAFDDSTWRERIVSTDSRTDAVYSSGFVRKWSIVFP